MGKRTCDNNNIENVQWVNKLVQIDAGEPRPDEQKREDSVPRAGRCGEDHTVAAAEGRCDEADGPHPTALLRGAGAR